MATPMVLANWLTSVRFCPKASFSNLLHYISDFHMMKLLEKQNDKDVSRCEVGCELGNRRDVTCWRDVRVMIGRRDVTHVIFALCHVDKLFVF